MIRVFLKRKMDLFFAPLTRYLAKTGISPNQLTLMGFLINCIAGLVFIHGLESLAGLLVLLAGAFDFLDGSLARYKGMNSHFGAFLDSTIDRFSEAVVYLGMLTFYIQHHMPRVTVLVFAAFIGSFMVSYARARAEGLGYPCEVGWLTRSERVLILSIGMMLRLTLPTLWFLAILTNFTALQRMLFIWKTNKENMAR